MVITLCRVVIVSVFCFSGLSSAAPSSSGPSSSRDVLEIQGMSVKGNAEQPKILYLIPWQATTNPQDVVHPPIDKLEGAIQFIEPEEFQKQLYFRQNLRVNVEAMPKN